MEQRLKFDYLRLSKEDGDVAEGFSEESQSIASQRACIRQYRKARPDLAEGFEEIVDDGYSGTHFERPGIKKLLKLVEDQEKVCKYMDISELNDSLMRELVKKVIVYPDGLINIVWNFTDLTK